MGLSMNKFFLYKIGISPYDKFKKFKYISNEKFWLYKNLNNGKFYIANDLWTVDFNSKSVGYEFKFKHGIHAFQFWLTWG